jgi:hypothetical protein
VATALLVYPVATAIAFTVFVALTVDGTVYCVEPAVGVDPSVL